MLAHRLVPIIGLLWVACASVRPITGGEKDNTAPAFVGAVPAQRTTRFDAKAILLEFDERIQLDRARERMLVSPPLAEKPDVRLVGPRSLEIRLNGDLVPGTTYTFNLGECVKDLTEGNVASGLTYVMSTGDVLDSARIAGRVLNAFTGAPEKEMIVGLYAPGDTGSFRRGRPAYMTRTDATGNFGMANLPHGTFSLLALHDKNADLRYDLPNEEIAFQDSAVHLSPSDTVPPSYVLHSFLPLSAHQQVRSYSVTVEGALELVLARAVDTVAIRDVGRTGGTRTWSAEFNPTRDTVLLWPSDTTLVNEGAYEIRDRSTVLDTLRYRRTKPMPFHLRAVASVERAVADTRILVRSSRPVEKVDSTRITVEVDSIPVTFRLEQGKELRSLWVVLQTPTERPIDLLLSPKALRDVLGAGNDTLRSHFGAHEDLAMGELAITMKGLRPDVHHLLQILDAQQHVEHEAPVTLADPVVKWGGLLPGVRTLRLVEDKNNNGRWDSGEWHTQRQAERTWHHAEPVNVRAAWNVEVEWRLPKP